MIDFGRQVTSFCVIGEPETIVGVSKNEVVCYKEGMSWIMYRSRGAILYSLVISKCLDYFFVGNSTGQILVFKTNVSKEGEQEPVEITVIQAERIDCLLVWKILPVSATDLVVVLNSHKNQNIVGMKGVPVAGIVVQLSLVIPNSESESEIKVKQRWVEEFNFGNMLRREVVSISQPCLKDPTKVLVGEFCPKFYTIACRDYFNKRVSRLDCRERTVFSYEQRHKSYGISLLFTFLNEEDKELFFSADTKGKVCVRYVYPDIETESCRGKRSQKPIWSKKFNGVIFCSRTKILPWLDILITRTGELYAFSYRHRFLKPILDDKEFDKFEKEFWEDKGLMEIEFRKCFPVVQSKGKVVLASSGSTSIRRFYLSDQGSKLLFNHLEEKMGNKNMTKEPSNVEVLMEEDEGEVVELEISRRIVQRERKFAFVAGQNVEGEHPLRYPYSDCILMSDRLKDLGYDVTECFFKEKDKEKLTFHKFDGEFIRFLDKVREGDKVVFYFSGHGFRKEGENYLQCVKNREKNHLRDMELSYLIRHLRKKKSINFFFLDCCQDDPNDKAWASEKGKGSGKADLFGGFEVEDGQFVFGYACLPGQRALERGDIGGGVFTHYLLNHLDEKTEIISIIRKTIRDMAMKQKRRASFFSTSYDELFL